MRDSGHSPNPVADSAIQVSHTLDSDEERLKRSLEEQGAGLQNLFDFEGGDDDFDTGDIEKVRLTRGTCHWCALTIT